MEILTSGELGGPKSCFPSPPEQTNICCYVVLKILPLWKIYHSTGPEQLWKSNIQ